ncbi:MAG: long-chain fatty acid--CoA ligase, partial [Arthrobacter sp.]
TIASARIESSSMAGMTFLPLEDSIRADAIVSQCVVVGDQRPFISALITIDEEALPGWLERHGMPATTTVAEAAQSRQLQDELQALVDRANKAVSQAEAIKVFRVVTTDFTESSGHLTPSLKIKRAQVLKDFSDVVEDIYSGQKV